MDDYETISFHKLIAKAQRNAYKNHLNAENLKNKILIEIDYKQKIKIGFSPRQITREYYEQKERSCLGKSCYNFGNPQCDINKNRFLGIGVYYVNKNNEVKVINFDVISSDLNENSYTTVRGLRLLREQKFFQNIEKPDYIVWTDCGKHFRNKQLIGYLFNELGQKSIQG